MDVLCCRRPAQRSYILMKERFFCNPHTKAFLLVDVGVVGCYLPRSLAQKDSPDTGMYSFTTAVVVGTLDFRALRSNV